jgi:hypothetical protein
VTSGAGIGGSASFGGIASLNIHDRSFCILDEIVGVRNADFNSIASLTIGSLHIDCRLLGTHVCLRASSVVVDHSSVGAVIAAPNLIDFETVMFSESTEIFPVCTGHSQQEKFTGILVIHIESVPFPSPHIYDVTATDNHNFERSVLFNFLDGRGFDISVPSIGNYLIKYTLPDGSSAGCMIHGDLSTFGVLSANDAFFATVEAVNESGKCFVVGTRSFTDNRLERDRVHHTIIRFSAFLFIECV